MRRAMLVGAVCALLGSTLSALSIGEDSSNAEYWVAENARLSKGTPGLSVFGTASRGRAATMVASEIRSRLGEGWVETGLRIARVESGFNCAARNPSSGATGLGQLMFRSAEILEPGSGARRADCATGARLMALHMRRCLDSGATTAALMARCHLAGWNSINARLKHRAERYVLRYQRMVKGARPVQVAGVSEWLVRGTTSIWR